MRRTSVISCLFLLSVLTGCQLFGNADNGKLGGGGMDMFTPVKMRLHPLSRIVPSSSASTVPSVSLAEARLELTDQFGDIGKGVGNAQFDLFAYDALGFNHRGRRLGQWQMSLSTPAENREHWDAITRTYLFKLPLAAGTLDGRNRLILIGTFTLPNGQELTDDITLPAK